MWQYNNIDELYHHGVPGMRWGFRRYQNKDGSLTPAGRKRAAKLKQQYLEVTGKQLKGRAVTTKGKTTQKVSDKEETKKSIKDMTDAELREKTTRMTLEKDYINAVNAMNNLKPKEVSRGKKFINSVMRDVVVPAATDVTKQLVKSYMVKFTNESLNLDNEYKVHTNNKKKN